MSGAWEQASRQRLTDEFARLRALLGLVVSGSEQMATPSAPAPSGDAPTALDTLCELFRLSPFERDLLLLCAGVELDSEVARLVAAASGEPRVAAPTLALALAALPGAHWSALTPAGALRRWRLITVGVGPALLHSPLRIDERVLHYLAGVEHLDTRLAGIARPVAPASQLTAWQELQVQRITEAWRGPRSGVLPLVQLCGDDRSALREVAAAACRALGLGIYAIAADTLPAAPAEVEALARLWEREAALAGLALLIEQADDAPEGGRGLAARRLAEQVSGAVLIAGRERLADLVRPDVAIELPRPTASEQRALWQAALGPAAESLSGHIDVVASQFSLSGGAIRAAARSVIASDAEGMGDALWAACREQARPRLEGLAQRVESPAGWDDLVLPEEQLSILRGVVAHVRRRATVVEAWGFGRRGGRGMGVTALFAGPSGVGKTLAAEVLANELRLDLYRVDLSQVVSKYIGETEKNLRQVFDAAEGGGAILLFDEADALFGKRSEVKDSHDRHANVEVSYLLQRMEAYRGLAVLTTNMKQALDPAFLRRLRFVVTFPFPDTAQRAAIWRRAFPPGVPTGALDVEKLARLSVAGGAIQNIALGAAFLAAEDGRPVAMAHVLAAARAEYAKLDRKLTEAESMGWTETAARS